MRIVFLCLVAIAVAGCTTERIEVSPATPATPATPTAETTDAPRGAQEYVIDVRTQEEWDAGHVEQAVHIPHTEIAQRIPEVTDDKQAKIVLYCAAGGRAGKAKTALEELGFTNVENAGGYDDIKQRYSAE